MIVWFFTSIVSLIICTVVILYWYQLKQVHKSIPCPRILPLLGNILEWGTKREDLHLELMNISKKNGDLIQLWIGPFFKMYLCTNRDIVRELTSSYDHLDKPDYFRNSVKSMVGDPMAIASAIKWRKYRKIASPAFGTGMLQNNFETFNKASETLIANLRQYSDTAQKVPMYHYISDYLLDILIKSSMGLDLNTKSDIFSTYKKALTSVLTVVSMRLTSFILLQSDFIFYHVLKYGKELNDALDTTRRITDYIIRERRDILVNNLSNKNQQNNLSTNINQDIDADSLSKEKQPMPYIDLLLQATVDGQSVPNYQIHDEVNQIILAGYEAAANSISFTLYLLAKHQEIQTILYNDIINTLGRDLSKMTSLSALNNVKYLDLVIKESLRLYPPAPTVARVLDRPIKYGDTILDKGSNILIFAYGLHRDPELFEDPEEFKPERFLDEKTIRNYSYMPFSLGPRSCLGQKYALCQIKLILSTLLKDYELYLADPSYKLELRFGGIVEPKQEIYFKLKSRRPV